MFYFNMQGPRGVVLSPVEMREVTSPGVKNVKRENEPPAKHITDAEARVFRLRPGIHFAPLSFRGEDARRRRACSVASVQFGNVSRKPTFVIRRWKPHWKLEAESWN